MLLNKLTLLYVCVYFMILNGCKPTATNFTGVLPLPITSFHKIDDMNIKVS